MPAISVTSHNALLSKYVCMFLKVVSAWSAHWKYSSCCCWPLLALPLLLPDAKLAKLKSRLNESSFNNVVRELDGTKFVSMLGLSFDVDDDIFEWVDVSGLFICVDWTRTLRDAPHSQHRLISYSNYCCWFIMQYFTMSCSSCPIHKLRPKLTNWHSRLAWLNHRQHNKLQFFQFIIVLLLLIWVFIYLYIFMCMCECVYDSWLIAYFYMMLPLKNHSLTNIRNQFSYIFNE